MRRGITELILTDLRRLTGRVGLEPPQVRAAIEEALRGAGRDPNPETIEHVLADVMAIALRRLGRRPAKWSMAAAQSTEART